MIILKINQPGLVLSLSQLRKDIRTPAELTVSHQNIDRIVRELRNYGVNDFELRTTSDLEYEYSKKLPTQEKPKQKQVSVSSTSSSNETINQLEKAADRIINKIEEATNRLDDKLDKIRDIKGQPIEPKSNDPKGKQKSVEDEEEFIPDIHLDGLEKHGDSSKKEVDQDVSEENSEDLSKKLSGRSKKE